MLGDTTKFTRKQLVAVEQETKRLGPVTKRVGRYYYLKIAFLQHGNQAGLRRRRK